MKFLVTIACLFIIHGVTFGQKVDSIYFHLYTDSLKKGTNNYINVDGRLSNGSWKPLTGKEIVFSSDYGKFEGNDLVIPESPEARKIKIRVELKANPAIWKETTIWIKQKPDPPLPKKSGN